ncbi:DUF1460 domain-containing protein [Nocardia sp. SYP-A9097]|uniref:DUF1460 domain-containing protein n=1 Tax=Nocardia sp. SYP-A9097 TaxID=2663237 RepID=UPI00132B2093|nr:DUF1460 domain-containing protein [Nocardia sp. SYP-A9097]MRH90761.1 DUF1460 domain-containing protein [Nocardia sp. SYP-A9097]
MRTIARILLVLLVLVGGAGLLGPTALATPSIDDATASKLDELLAVRQAAGALTKGEVINQLSAHFLGTPYGANMLVGSATVPEELVVDLRRVDCFTLLDYVEALSRSTTRDDFLTNLTETRYTNATVDFLHRKHFFTDWATTSRTAAEDITATLTPAAITVPKHLNTKSDGTAYLPGLPAVDRNITYIPANAVNDAVISQLRTGDYIAAYADQPGLDVSHVGIFISTPTGPIFRNATSLSAYQVVDTPLTDYVATTPGLIVLRPH